MKIALSTAVLVGGLLFSQFTSAASIATYQGVPTKTIAAATASRGGGTREQKATQG
jgi:hypothetical protein